MVEVIVDSPQMGPKPKKPSPKDNRLSPKRASSTATSSRSKPKRRARVKASDADRAFPEERSLSDILYPMPADLEGRDRLAMYAAYQVRHYCANVMDAILSDVVDNSDIETVRRFRKERNELIDGVFRLEKEIRIDPNPIERFMLSLDFMHRLGAVFFPTATAQEISLEVVRPLVNYRRANGENSEAERIHKYAVENATEIVSLIELWPRKIGTRKDRAAGKWRLIRATLAELGIADKVGSDAPLSMMWNRICAKRDPIEERKKLAARLQRLDGIIT